MNQLERLRQRTTVVADAGNFLPTETDREAWRVRRAVVRLPPEAM
jgi:hypothetical protein